MVVLLSDHFIMMTCAIRLKSMVAERPFILDRSCYVEKLLSGKKMRFDSQDHVALVILVNWGIMVAQKGVNRWSAAEFSQEAL